MEIPTCNCTWPSGNLELYCKEIQNDKYIPYVYGFVISVTSIGLLTSIYYANLEYKQKTRNGTNVIILIILILIFLGLVGYSGYKIGDYSSKNLSLSFDSDKAILPCYSKYTKSIVGFNDHIIEQETVLAGSSIPVPPRIKFTTIDGQLVDSSFNIVTSNIGDLQSYSSDSNSTLRTTVNTNTSKPNDEETKTLSNPYNTRTSNSTSDICGNATPGSATLEASGTSTSTLGNTVNIRNNSRTPTSTIGRTNSGQVTQTNTTNSDSINQQQGSTLLDANGNLRVSG